SPTSGGELADWSCAIQSWLDTRLAEWNTQEPVYKGCVTTSVDALETNPDSALPDAEPSAPALNASAESADARVNDTNAAADRACAAVVEEMVEAFTQITEPAPGIVKIETEVPGEPAQPPRAAEAERALEAEVSAAEPTDLAIEVDEVAVGTASEPAW